MKNFSKLVLASGAFAFATGAFAQQNSNLDTYQCAVTGTLGDRVMVVRPGAGPGQERYKVVSLEKVPYTIVFWWYAGTTHIYLRRGEQKIVTLYGQGGSQVVADFDEGNATVDCMRGTPAQ